jgi:UDP-glucose 4-epimerase
VKVLITGGAGYVGTELVYELALIGGIEEIIVYDNLCKRNFNLFTGLRKVPAANIRFVQADILDRRSLERAIEGVDVLFHLAAKVDTPYADQNSHEFEQVNNWGTAEVMFAAEMAEVGTIVYLSSQSVYSPGTVTDTGYPTAPSCFYGLTKLRGERHVHRLSDKCRTIIVRCAQVYGYSKNLRFETILNRMIFDAHFSSRIAIHGDPDYSSTFISVDRLAVVLAGLVRSDNFSGIYNLSRRLLSSLEIGEALQQVYTGLEIIFVDQHITMEDRNMLSSDEFQKFFESGSDSDLVMDLERFKDKFTF